MKRTLRGGGGMRRGCFSRGGMKRGGRVRIIEKGGDGERGGWGRG